jgi:hypothetical protein
MKVQGSSMVHALAAAAALAALAACQSTPKGPSGPPTTMAAANVQFRTALPVEPTPLRAAFYRQLPRCSYAVGRALTGKPATRKDVALTIRPVRDRLLITLQEGGEASTALIGADGTMHDFNLRDDEGVRWTSDDYGARAARLAAQGAGSVINQFTAMFPRYQQGPWMVDAPVAEVHDQTGAVWARYYYRGLTNSHGRRAAVLDMLSATSANGTPLLTGYNIVDAESLVPLLYVFQTHNEVRFERLSCP